MNQYSSLRPNLYDLALVLRARQRVRPLFRRHLRRVHSGLSEPQALQKLNVDCAGCLTLGGALNLLNNVVYELGFDVESGMALQSSAHNEPKTA